MKKIALFLGLLLATPSFAADNAAVVTPGVGLTLRSVDVGAGIQAIAHALVNASGTQIGVAGSEVFVGGRGTAGAAAGGVLTVQGVASMTPFLTTTTLNAETTKVIGTVNQGTSPWVVSNGGTFLSQVNGFTSWAGGTLGAMATYGTSPGAVNVPGVNAFVTNTLAPGQAAAASSSPVVLAKNSGTGSTVAGAAIGTAGTASAEVVTVQGIASMTPILSRPSDGTRNGIIDPCEATLQSYAPISITTATTTRIVAPSASNKTYICHLFLTSAAADNVGIVEGTGGTCGTATAGVIGGTTAANGPNFAANGGVALHAGGKVAVAQTAGTNVDLCLITSAATPLAGGIKYVQAP